MKTVLITGASRGIGRSAARLFAKRGWNVAINYNNSEDAAKLLTEEINSSSAGRAFAFRADVSDESQVQSMFNEAVDRFSKIDALVNNAGTASQQLLTDLTVNEWDRLFSINVRGAFLCSRAALGSMISRKRGKIINVSSVWGITGASCEVAYSASKAAIIGFTKALAKEVGPSGINVNCVAPGVVKTDMNAGLTKEDLEHLAEENALGRIGEPEEIAEAIYYLASEKSDFITGQVLCPDGGFVI